MQEKPSCRPFKNPPPRPSTPPPSSTALTALKKGDFSLRLPSDWTGVAGKVADAFNDVIELNERMASELERLSRVVGKEGKLTQRATLGDVSGSWASPIDSVNDLIGDLVHPTSETARVIGAVAKGDLSQTMALEIDDRPARRASSCAPPRPSTRWSISSARSPRK